MEKLKQLAKVRDHALMVLERAMRGLHRHRIRISRYYLDKGGLTMKKICKSCGQEYEVETEDVTKECTLEWHRHGDTVMIDIMDGNRTVAVMGIDGYSVVWKDEYELELAYKSHTCGWWFKVKKLCLKD